MHPLLLPGVYAPQDDTRLLARALYDEGMTMEQIAAKFGVTRQRVSSLLREARSDGA